MKYFQAGDFQAAEKRFKDVIRKVPGHAVTLGVLGAVQVRLTKFREAASNLETSLKSDPNSYANHYNLGLALKGLGSFDAALASFTRSIALNERDPDTWNNRGTVFNELRNYDRAIADFDKAIALQPNNAGALANKGKSLVGLARYDEAISIYKEALSLNPNLVEAWYGVGEVFHKVKRHADAANAYANALRVEPNHPFLKGTLLHQKLLMCDWSGVNASITEIENDFSRGLPAAEPFGWQGVATSPLSLQRCAEIYNRSKFPAFPPSNFPRSSSPKIRIGYVSGEFREQATSLLVAGVLEQHDRSQFEVFAFDNGYDDGGETRKRINAALDDVIDIGSLSDDAAAAAIREANIDILINLNGYFGADRTAVFARRPAPVQVNYLGFPGTIGANYIDYIIADRVVIPEPDRRFYTEKVVYLPHCYQPNDNRRRISAHAYNRSDFGLPQDGFVFCCFNNNYKIMPETFERWMQILKNAPGSVLWLIEDNAEVKTNLQREASARGCEPERLIFSGRIPPPEHLARHRCANLFLDTLPYNAHTTASDALWAGLPVLTCTGNAFPGRVASSLLGNIGLPELITTSLAEYEKLAVALATQPQRLAALQAKLAANRDTTPLFDTQLYTKHLERAYAAMHQRRQSGARPEHLSVSDS